MDLQDIIRLNNEIITSDMDIHAGEWYSVVAFKPFKIFDVNLRTNFNLESMAGFKFDRPQFFYAYKKVVTNSYHWDSNLTLSGSYPNYTFSAESTISSESVIIVLAFEGDY